MRNYRDYKKNVICRFDSCANNDFKNKNFEIEITLKEHPGRFSDFITIYTNVHFFESSDDYEIKTSSKANGFFPDLQEVVHDDFMYHIKDELQYYKIKNERLVNDIEQAIIDEVHDEAF